MGRKRKKPPKAVSRFSGAGSHRAEKRTNSPPPILRGRRADAIVMGSNVTTISRFQSAGPNTPGPARDQRPTREAPGPTYRQHRVTDMALTAPTSEVHSISFFRFMPFHRMREPPTPLRRKSQNTRNGRRVKGGVREAKTLMLSYFRNVSGRPNGKQKNFFGRYNCSFKSFSAGKRSGGGVGCVPKKI